MERAGGGLCTYEREGRERGRPFALLLCSQIMRIDGLVVRVLDCVAPLFTKTVAPRAHTHTRGRSSNEGRRAGKKRENKTQPNQAPVAPMVTLMFLLLTSTATHRQVLKRGRQGQTLEKFVIYKQFVRICEHKHTDQHCEEFLVCAVLNWNSLPDRVRSFRD